MPFVPQKAKAAYNIMAKPVGASCNLDCQYCYYLEKERLYEPSQKKRMSPEVLESFIRDYIESQPVPEITFAWQGGEPTLYGLESFREIVALQKRYAAGKRIQNAIQTNGTLLTDEWARFFVENDFLVGISVDGPPKLHDTYRLTRRGEPSYASVTRGLNLLHKHGVAFNTLTVVNRRNAEYPREVYRFLRQHGSGHMQFIPLVERLPDEGNHFCGMKWAGPPHPEDEGRPIVTEWSVRPQAYGKFLSEIFKIWVREDVGKVFVQDFEGALTAMVGRGASMCVHAETCGRALIVEFNGDVYACDHFVYPEFQRGSLMETPLAAMVDTPEQQAFGDNKRDRLPKVCLQCPVLELCQGGCPKHRFTKSSDGEDGLNYLCQGYKTFFKSAVPDLARIGWELGLLPEPKWKGTAPVR